MKPRLAPWLTILIVLAAGTAGLGFLLIAQDAVTLGRVVVGVGQLLTYAWIARGLFLWRHVGWVAKTARIILFTMAAAFFVVTSQTLGSPATAIMFLGVWGMGLAFMLGLELLRLALNAGHPVLGIARTLLDEAIRMKMAVIFVVMLVLLVPFLPFALGDETRLQYRLESFLTYSLMLVTALLSLMTILLSVRTVSSELSERQAFLTLTKPVSRVSYLAGKWVGIMALNLLLVVVSGIGVYAFVKVLERQQPMDLADAIAVHEQVLTARSSARPVPVDNALLIVDFNKRLEDLRLKGADPQVYGQIGDPITQVTPQQRQRIQLEAMREWLTIAPLNQQTYRFTGLEKAKGVGPSVQLRFKPKASSSADDSMVYFEVRVNDRPFLDTRTTQPIPPVRTNTFHTAYIPTEDISDEGTLDLTIINTAGDIGQSSISFKPGEGMELFYKVGSFETNLAKGLFVMWVRLGFLAALRIAAATFLGFPVACLFCFLIFFAAIGSTYLFESFNSYASLPKADGSTWGIAKATLDKLSATFAAGEYEKVFKQVIALVGRGFMVFVPPMATYSPTPRIAYGRVVENAMMFGVVLRIGLMSSGIVAAFAVWTFSRREIAQVTV